MFNFKLCFLQSQGEDVDFRGVLHRDGSVLMAVSLEQLKVKFPSKIFET